MKAVTIPSYKELKNYASWLADNNPCLINMYLDPATLLIPKIKWEAGKIMPLLEESLAFKVNELLEK